MTHDNEPADASSFRDALSRLVHNAHENGVDVRGGWECESETGDPDWDTIITAVSERTDESSDRSGD